MSDILFQHVQNGEKISLFPGFPEITLPFGISVHLFMLIFAVMGPKRGDKWLPFFLSQFIFLLTVNLLGLIPFLKTATGNINVTISMALMVFVLVFVVGIKNLVFFHFFKNLFPAGTNLPIGIFVALLQFLGLITKSVVLSLRFFANMFAGHLAILSFLVLIFVINPFRRFRLSCGSFMKTCNIWHHLRKRQFQPVCTYKLSCRNI